MKKFIALTLCACMLLTACQKPLPSETIDAGPLPENLVETTSDSAVLEDIWEDYIDDVFFTIANGYRSFASVEDIAPPDLVSFLYLKMQREGEKNVTVRVSDPEYGELLCIKREKLEQYCEKYFNETVDFTKNSRNSGAVYFPDVDAVYLMNAYNLENLPVVGYDDIADFPNAALTSIEHYSDGYVVANITEQTALAVDVENELIYRRIVLREREDKSLYFVSGDFKFTETNRISFTGNAEKLPYRDEYAQGYVVAFDDTFFTASVEGDEVLLTTYAISTAEQLASYTISLHENYVSNQLYGELSGEKYYFWDGVNITILNRDLSGEPEIIPFAFDENTRIQDIHHESDSIVLVNDEGLFAVEIGRGVRVDIASHAPTVLDEQGAPLAEIPNTFGSVSFVDGASKVFYCINAYEGIESFALYDIATGETKQFAYSSGYDGTVIALDGGFYLNNVWNADGEFFASLYIDYDDGAARVLSEVPQGEIYWQMLSAGNNLGLCVKILPQYTEPQDITDIYILDTKISGTHPTGVTITSPPNTVHALAIDNEGTGYILASYLGERFVLRVVPQWQ